MIFQINPEISKASTLSKEFYLDSKYFSFSKNIIFPNSWQFIIDIQELTNNNIYPFILLPDFIDESLILIKSENSFNCFSNTCTHRAHTVIKKACNQNILRCMYHGRTFHLNGKFKSMPGFEKAKHFPTQLDNLTEVPCLRWEKFIFVSLKNKINIKPILNDINDRIPNYPFQDLFYNKQNSKQWEIDAHWALYCENYLEGFHVPFVHKGLSKEIELNSYETVLIDNGVLQIARYENKKNIIKIFNDNIYGLYYWIFPNIMLNFYSWGLSINIIEPILKNRTRIRFLSYPIKNIQQPQKGEATLDRVEHEDQQVVLNVQKGIKSRFYNSGRYSPQYESGVHHFHLLLSKYLN